jgi:signal transduction histidine kinase
MVVVAAVSLSGLVAVVISSLRIVHSTNREQMERSNRQVSDLVSRATLSQLQDYRRGMEMIFRSWTRDPEFQLDAELLPDFVWVAMLDVTNRTVYEWSRPEVLAENGMSAEQLLGFKKRDVLADEVRALFADRDQWMIFNSSTTSVFPTFLLGTTFSNQATLDRRFVVLAEIQGERLYSQVQSRAGQELVLIDSHQNILLSTRPQWDASKLNFDDTAVTKLLSQLTEGQSDFRILEDPKAGDRVLSLFKFKEGGGLSLVLQEPLSNLTAIEDVIQWRSLMIVLIVMVVMLNLLIFFANSIISPLSQLTRLMERVGKGEFNGKIKVKAKDEIGRLATVFNKMITDLKSREEEIERAKSRLVQSEKMSAFGQMSAGIAHEVKNPLAGILGYTQMTRKKLTPDSEVLPYLDIIEKETVRCKEIVENLMRFARQEKAVMARIDINKTVKDSIRLVEHQMSISGIKVNQVLALEGAPIWLTGNSNQIQQVMMNLMLNAQQAMDNKGTLTITTHYEPEASRMIILISDTGAGMSEEVKQRIFEPFYTTKGVGKGTGLGLSVSIGIIKDHGGSIDVESQIGKGTTFSITLPCGTSNENSDNQAAA